MEDIKIRISGDPAALQPTIDKVVELGKADAKNADQYKKTQKEFEIAATKRKQLIDQEMRDLNSLYDKKKKAFAVSDINSYNAAISESKKRIELLKDAEDGVGGGMANLVKETEKASSSLGKAYGLLRTAANIIPGLGISGIILAGYEVLASLIGNVSENFAEMDKQLKTIDDSLAKIGTGSMESLAKAFDLPIDEFIDENIRQLRRRLVELKDLSEQVEADYYEKNNIDYAQYVEQKEKIKEREEKINDDIRKQELDLTKSQLMKYKEGLDKQIEAAKEKGADKLALLKKQFATERNDFKLEMDVDGDVKKVLLQRAEDKINHYLNDLSKERAEKAKQRMLRENKEIFDQAIKEYEALRKALAMNSPLEMEMKDFNDRLKAAGIYGKSKEKMTALEMAAYQELLEQHNKKINDIIDGDIKEKLEKDKKYYEDQAVNAKLGFKKLLVDKKISAEQYQVEIDRIEVEKLKRQIDAGDTSLELEAKYQEAVLKLREDTSKKSAAITQKALEGIKTFADAAGTIIENVIDQHIKSIDHQEGLIKDSIDRQQRLAEKGLDNDLAGEKKRMSELERQRMIEQKKLIKVKELETFLNSVAAYSKQDPSTAILKAGVQLALLKGAEAIYMEEGGLIGASDNTLSRFSRKHRGGGDVLLHAQKGEGVLSRKDIAALGGPDGFRAFKSALGGPLKERQIPMDKVLMPSFNTKKLEARIESLEETIKNKREVSVDWEKMADSYAMVVSQTEKGVTDTVKYMLKNHRIRG